MVDSHANELDIAIRDRDFTITQSPGVLNSVRAGGTTGAALWKVTPRLAEWFFGHDNQLFRNGVLGPRSSVLELGAGVAGILPALLAPRVGRYIATDQQYALKLLGENIKNNTSAQRSGGSRKSHKNVETRGPEISNVDLLPLDWETDDILAWLRSYNLSNGVDVILACDCIYNYSLIRPFVQTCIDICQARLQNGPATICLVAQQLRQPDVFEEWLALFMQDFQTWRLSGSTVGTRLDEASGFVVHVGILQSPQTR